MTPNHSASILAIALAITARAGPVEDSFQVFPPGATDLVPRFNIHESLSASTEVIYGDFYAGVWDPVSISELTLDEAAESKFEIRRIDVGSISTISAESFPEGEK